MNIYYINSYTEAEFEDIQSHFDGKAEFDNGFIFLSSNTSIDHNNIKRNILMYLSMYLKETKCRAYDEQIEVIFRNKDDIRKYKPDIFVMCEDSTDKEKVLHLLQRLYLKYYLNQLQNLIKSESILHMNSLVFQNII